MVQVISEAWVSGVSTTKWQHSQLTDMLDDVREEVLAFTQYPLVFWKKIRTNNPLENHNSQIY